MDIYALWDSLLVQRVTIALTNGKEEWFVPDPTLGEQSRTRAGHGSTLAHLLPSGAGSGIMPRVFCQVSGGKLLQTGAQLCFDTSAHVLLMSTVKRGMNKG